MPHCLCLSPARAWHRCPPSRHSTPPHSPQQLRLLCQKDPDATKLLRALSPISATEGFSNQAFPHLPCLQGPADPTVFLRVSLLSQTEDAGAHLTRRTMVLKPWLAQFNLKHSSLKSTQSPCSLARVDLPSSARTAMH